MPNAYGLMGAQAGFDIGAGIINNLFGAWREDRARKANYELSEMAAENADRRTRALYNDLQSPQALMKQYKDAGLSPALMYGNTPGTGGMTQGAQGTFAGTQPNTFGINPIDLAQIEALNAQANLNNAKADTERGENERGQQEIINLMKQAGFTEAATKYNESLTIGQNIKNYVDSESAEANISKICSESELAAQKVLEAIADVQIKQAKADRAIEFTEKELQEIDAHVNYLDAQKLLAKSHIKLNEKQSEMFAATTEKVRKEVKQMTLRYWSDLASAETDRQVKKITAKYYDTLEDYIGQEFDLKKFMVEQENKRAWKQLTWSVVWDGLKSVGTAVGGAGLLIKAIK